MIDAETAIPGLDKAPTRHEKLVTWVGDIARLTQPDRVHWCDGSDAEWERLTGELIKAGTLTRLNPDKRPNSFYANSDPRRRGAGGKPHLHLLRAQGRRRAHQQLDRAGRDARDLNPCSPAPCAGAPCMSFRSAWARSVRRSRLGVEITDSAYVAISMRVMTRMGKAALEALGDDGDFVPPCTPSARR